MSERGRPSTTATRQSPAARGRHALALGLLALAFVGCGRETLGTPPSAELIAAAEDGDPEAQRQLANAYQPTESFGIEFGNAEKALHWYRRACQAGYANAQVDFYRFADAYRGPDADRVREGALACLDDAVAQGHRDAIVQRAFRAAYLDDDPALGYELYARLADADPEMAERRNELTERLDAGEIATAEARAAAWRAENRVKSYDDVFAELDSPFWQVSTKTVPTETPPPSPRP